MALKKNNQPNLGVRVGIILRSYRLSSGLSQTALAQKAGVSQSAISLIERGERSKLDTLDTVSRALGKRLTEVIERAEKIRGRRALERDWKRLKKRLGRHAR